MSQQIFELAKVSGVRILGVATVEDHAIRTVHLEVPFVSLTHTFDPETPGNLTGRELMALGHVLQELGAAMLGGDLRRDANKGY
jgi:hypothetical protein